MGRKSRLRQAKKKCYRNQIEEFRVKDERALSLIKHHVDESILPLIADATSAREAWEILRGKFGDRGSNREEIVTAIEDKAAEEHDEKFEGSASQVDHSESHSSVQPVDEDEDKEEAASPAVENPAILIADDSVLDTEYEHFKFEVNLQGEVCEKVWDNNLFTDENGEKVDEKLLESKPNRAGTECNQPVTAEETYENDVLMPMRNYEIFEFAEIYNFFEDITVLDSIAIAKNELDENDEDCNFIADFDKIIESCMEDEICSEDAGDDEEDTTESIFTKWSLEEIRHYYSLMWQQATKEDERLMKVEDNMFQHAEMQTEFEAQLVKGPLHFIEEDETWQQAIDEFENIDERGKLKQLEEKRKKVKMKRQTRRIAEYKVWSKRKKKGRSR